MLDLSAKRTRIILYYPDGTGALDVSSTLESITPQNRALDQSGLCTTTATLRLSADPRAALTEELNPLVNTTRFERGCRVLVEQDFGSGYERHPRGALRILKRPKPPTAKSPYLDLSVGCLLSFNDWRTAASDDLQTSATATGALTYQEAINKLAAKAKLPSLHDTITSTIPVDFDYPRLNGGYVSQMGLLAYAVDRILWIDSQERLRVAHLNLSAAPFATLRVGDDEDSQGWDFEEPEEIPTEYVKAYWSKNQVLATTDPDPQRARSKNTQYDPVEQSVVYVQGLASAIPLNKRFVDAPLGILFPDKYPNNAALWTKENGEKYSYFGQGGRLDREEEKVFQPRGSVLPDLYPNDTFVIESRLVETQYQYVNGVTSKIATYTYEPFAKVYPSKVTGIVIGASELTLSGIEIQRWVKTNKGYTKTTSTSSLIEGDTSGGTSAGYSDSQNQPPAVAHRQSPTYTKEVPIEGKAHFPLYKSQYTERERGYEVPAMSTNEQAAHIASVLGKLLQGRQYRCTFTTALTSDWRTNYAPYRVVDWLVPDIASGGWLQLRYLLGTEAHALNATQTAVSCEGILIGVVSRYRTDGGTPAPIELPANAGDIEVVTTSYTEAVIADGGTSTGGGVEIYPYPLTLPTQSPTGTAATTSGTSVPDTGVTSGGGGGGGGTGLASYGFEGNLSDGSGSHNLTAIGSISYATGQSGQAVQFSGGFDFDTGEANRLESASTDFAFGNTDWHIRFYCYLPSVSGGTKPLISRADTFNLLLEWQVVYLPGTGFRVRFFNLGQSSIGAADFSISAATNTWYQVDATYTASTQTASIDVNASGTPATATLSTTPITLTGSDVRFCVGGDNINAVSSGFRVDNLEVNP